MRASRRDITLWSFLFGFLLASTAFAQDSLKYGFRALVLDARHDEPLAGVNVRVEGTTIGAASDAVGLVTVNGIPAGRQTLVFSFVGFEGKRLSVTFPIQDSTQTHVLKLEEEHGELGEIAVSATRTSRTIADQATRVETIAGEEIDEKISMEPSNISMLLNESPGITVQQTSAVTGGASIRIQGLDGRYTQILKDGFPLYGGFSGGLSLLQVPPLDLRQVEIIKGPASTLYGGDAIAGLVNLVSKVPHEERELSILANTTSAGGYDLGGFLSSRTEHAGVTFLLSGHVQDVFDAEGDLFSNIPEIRRLTLSPKLFYYPVERTTVSIGLTGTIEAREGGDIDVIRNGPSEGRTFFDRNESVRLTSQARLDHDLDRSRYPGLGRKILLTLKNSLSLFDRSIEVPDYRFDGRQLATYTEASLFADGGNLDAVFGLDLRTDAFREDAGGPVAKRDYSYISTGAFAQSTWDVSESVVLETGLRADYHNEYGVFVLPRFSVLYRIADQLSARVGGGQGYKAPTVFLDPSEERAFRGVVPLGDGVEAERSRGGSIDVNYRALLFDRLAFSLNQAYYFTRLGAPLVPVIDDGALGETELLRYASANGHIRTRALETNVKLSLSHFKLFLGYVYLDARTDYGGTDGVLPLTPEHKTYSVLVYEKHGTGRIGFEAYYTGPQTLSDGTRTDGYWITGVMAERRVGPARLFLNFENFLDTKQSNYASVVRGTRSDPRFSEIWAPMDGFVINGGVKFTL